jgi:hypothetical protein
MDPLFIKGTDDTPEVILDRDKGMFVISGKSFPDDPFSTYQPVFEWLEKYFESPNDETVFELKLVYVNTASSKQITDILLILKENMKKSNITIKWYYDRMDDDMLFEGETLQTTLKISMELIEM